jgi:hypothetical protein
MFEKTGNAACTASLIQPFATSLPVVRASCHELFGERQLASALVVATKSKSERGESGKLTLACIVCSQPLKPSGNRVLRCTYCGVAEPRHFICPEQHYVCETCRVTTPTSLILHTHIAPTTRDAFAVADLLTRRAATGPASPGHPIIVPAVLSTACRNAGLPRISEANLRLASGYASRPPLGACASWGAATGSEICHSPNPDAGDETSGDQ